MENSKLLNFLDSMIFVLNSTKGRDKGSKNKLDVLISPVSDDVSKDFVE